jgi:hypothetical protein
MGVYPGPHRRKQPAVYKRRRCSDERNYTPVQFTIPGPVTTGDKSPMWRADRDYYIAVVTANVGKHDSGTHPNDGTPSGQDILINIRRVKKDYSADGAVLTLDSRVRIQENHHHDSSNTDEDGEFVADDVAIKKLYFREHIYPTVVQVGSGRPGTNLVVTVMLIPVTFARIGN